MIFDRWNPWTDRSASVPFCFGHQGVGNGEMKLGCEWGVDPMGQNFAYDPVKNNQRFEVKTIDQDRSFRIGVGIQHSYNEFHFHLCGLLKRICDFSKQNHALVEDTNIPIGRLVRYVTSHLLLDRSDRQCLFDTVFRNEISRRSLRDLYEIVETIRSCRVSHQDSRMIGDKKISLFSVTTGEQNYYNVLEASKRIYFESSVPHDTAVRLVCEGDEDFYLPSRADTSSISSFILFS